MDIIRWLLQYKKRSRYTSWQRTPTSLLKPMIVFDEEGRRHRTDVPYLLPKDKKEVSRLDYQHFVL